MFNSLFIARRLYKGEGMSKKVSRPAIAIATLGVAIGVAVVIVSMAVVLGFKHTIRDKVVGFGSHVVVENFMSLQTSKTEPIVVGDSLMTALREIEGVRHVQRFAMTQGIIKTDNDFLGVTFKGVDEDFDTAFIASCLVEGELPRFSREKSSNKILVSRSIADKLQIKAGEKLFAYFMNDSTGVRARRFTVTGIYQTNLSKYDETMCFADLYTVCKINGWGNEEVLGTELLLNDIVETDAVEDRLIDHIHHHTDRNGATYCSATVREMSPQIFSWLDLLDLNVVIILALMLSVAGFTIISGLLIIILEKTSMIGVLKALGARNKLIRHTFLSLAMMIVCKGIFWGNVLGVGICLLQSATGLIKLDPATYYVDVVPVEITWPVWILINLGTIIACTLVLVLPSFFTSSINPARSMRYE